MPTLIRSARWVVIWSNRRGAILSNDSHVILIFCLTVEWNKRANDARVTIDAELTKVRSSLFDAVIDLHKSSQLQSPTAALIDLMDWLIDCSSWVSSESIKPMHLYQADDTKTYNMRCWIRGGEPNCFSAMMTQLRKKNNRITVQKTVRNITKGEQEN